MFYKGVWKGEFWPIVKPHLKEEKCTVDSFPDVDQLFTLKRACGSLLIQSTVYVQKALLGCDLQCSLGQFWKCEAMGVKVSAPKSEVMVRCQKRWIVLFE